MSFSDYLTEETTSEQIDALLDFMREKTSGDGPPPHFGKSKKIANIIGRVPPSKREKVFNNLVKLADEVGVQYITPEDNILEVVYNNQKVRLLVKPIIGSSKNSKDPHELMTAALCLKGEIIREVEDPDSLINDLKDYARKVENYDLDELKAFDGNYSDLAAACSAANKILERMKKIDKSYITGRQWSEEIKKFKISSGIIKDYNSSDIVLKGGEDSKDFLGVSLKKKKDIMDKDPTLINNAIDKFFKGVIDDNEFDQIIEAKNEFFKLVVEEYYGIKTSDMDFVYQKVREMNKKKETKEVINQYLRSEKNVFFKKVTEILENSKEEFIGNFLRNAFRVELKNLRKYDFEFVLVIGTGTAKGKSVRIKEGEYKDIDTISGVLDELIDSKRLTLERTRTKKQSFEKEATASKIFYTIYDGDDPLVDIEIRYKGSYTSQPQFFAFVTAHIKKLFKIKNIKTLDEK